jgi:parvulin-like peptidyl-prolyl isomerase
VALPAGCDRQKEGEEAVAWVNGEPIPFSTFWDEIKSRYNEVTEASSPQQDVLLVLKRKVLSDLIRERLLLQEASRRGLTVSEETLEARIDEIKGGFADSPLRKSLIKHSMDYDQWRQALRENMIMEALFTSVVREVGGVTDEEVSQYYKDHLDEFLVPEAVQLNQIVVKNRSKAQKLLRRIRKGESFETLAEKYSIGPEREASGHLGTYRRGELPEPLEKAAFSTPAGKVTSLVETQHGFHLLQVVKRIPSHVQSEEETHDKIIRKLLQEKELAFYDEWVTRLIHDSDIRVHASLVDLVVKEEPTKSLPFRSEANRELQ